MEIVWIILQSETFNPTNKTQKCKIWIEKNILKYVIGLQPNNNQIPNNLQAPTK